MQSFSCLRLLSFRHALLSGTRCLTSADAPRPVEVVLHSVAKRLEVRFSDGHTFQYPAELLRVESPSAGSGRPDASGRPKVVAGRRHVGILGLDPVGSYALRVKFDDLHDSGIFSYTFLHQLGLHKLSRMRAYLHRLKEQGLSRDPPPRRAAAAGGAVTPPPRKPCH